MSTMTPERMPQLDINEAFPIDPVVEACESFYAFSENFNIVTGPKLYGLVIGSLVSISGIPNQLAEIDGLRNEKSTTSLAIDLSKRSIKPNKPCQYTWHIDSREEGGLYINRRLTVGPDAVTGVIDVRRWLEHGGSGTTYSLELADVMRLMDVTKSLAVLAFTKISGQLDLNWSKYVSGEA